MKLRFLLPLLSVALLFSVLSLHGCGARDNLDTSLELNVKFGLEMAKTGHWNEAIMRWEKALSLNPNDARVHNNLAIAYENMGNFKKAEEHYEKATKLAPNNEDITFNYRGFKQMIKKRKAEDKTTGEVKNEKQ